MSKKIRLCQLTLLMFCSLFNENPSSCICVNIVIPDILKDHSQLQGKAVKEVTPDCLTLKALQSFKTQGTTYPKTKRDIPNLW